MAFLKNKPEPEQTQYYKYKDDRAATVSMELLAFGLILLFAFVPALIGAIIAFVSHLRKWRTSWLFLGGIAGTVLVFAFQLAGRYFDGIYLIITRKHEGMTAPLSFGEALFQGLLWMLPLSLGLGMIFAGFFLWLVEKRPELVGLPVKIEDNTVIKIEVDQRKLRNLPDIEDGVILGLDNQNEPVTLLDKEANMHAFISGATGAGKTNTIRVILESAIRRGKPVIVVDGKGDPGFLAEIQEMAEAYGRKFQGFSYKGKVKYNPLRHGDPTELKDKMMAVEQWTEPYYKRAAERYLQLVFRALKLAKMPIDLHTVQDMLTQKNLMEVLKKLKIDKTIANKMKEYVNTLDANHRNALDGLKDRIALLTESDVGPLFAEGEEGEDVIDLLEAVKDKRVVHMSLSGLSYSSFTPALGAMIVEDLKSVASAVGEQGWIDYIYVVLDEFNLFAGEQVVNMINKSRSAGFCCFIATQELADLSAGGGEELIGQVIGNTNVKIVHRQDVPDSAEYLSGVVGTQKVLDKTQVVETTIFGSMGTGSSSVRTVEEYRIHPNTLKNLGQGQAVVIKKIPDGVVSPTQIRPSPNIKEKLKKRNQKQETSSDESTGAFGKLKKLLGKKVG